MKYKIYFNEYNIPTGNAIYLPYASGLLRAFCESIPEIKEKYKFMPFIFKRDTIENLVAQHKNPYMACFSVAIWNYNLSLEVAKGIKAKYPKCRVVFGGASVPEEAIYPVDYVIKGAGEASFAQLLTTSSVVLNNINDIPSPYTTGLFDYLIDGTTEYQTIIETNRGCPFNCTYCYWGCNSKKVEFFNMQRIIDEAYWISENKIKYVFCADGNFGMYKRDIEIAKYYDYFKVDRGYPEKFRVCYGKKNLDNIFETAKILHKNNLGKSVTLAMQTMDENVAKNIQRSNMSVKEFDSMQIRYAKSNIHTYSELILGLPGETYESFKSGVTHILRYSSNNNLFIYHCSVLPNTRLADKDYQERHGIKTVRIPISEVHCEARTDNLPIEYEEIIIETNTMTKYEWIDLTAWSWMIQLKYSLGYELEIPEYIKYDFYKIAKMITEGNQRCQLVRGCGNIYWEPEEAAFLKLTMHLTDDPEQYAKEKILWGRKSGLQDTKQLCDRVEAMLS